MIVPGGPGRLVRRSVRRPAARVGGVLCQTCRPSASAPITSGGGRPDRPPRRGGQPPRLLLVELTIARGRAWSSCSGRDGIVAPDPASDLHSDRRGDRSDADRKRNRDHSVDHPDDVRLLTGSVCWIGEDKPSSPGDGCAQQPHRCEIDQASGGRSGDCQVRPDHGDQGRDKTPSDPDRHRHVGSRSSALWQTVETRFAAGSSDSEREGTWSRHSDLNRGPAVYETAALPLSYVGARASIGAAQRHQLFGRHGAHSGRCSGSEHNARIADNC
jgi:hypothetical protein